MASVKLGTKAVGSIVKLRVNNTAREFIVVQHGKPSSIYDDSFLSSTILLMKDIYETRQWHSSNTNDYANSTIHGYLNNTFINLFDADIKAAIKQVKVPYRPGSGTSSNVSTGASGLSAKIFLLSGYEMGWTNSDNQYFPADGARLAYFDAGTGTAANNKRIGYLGGTATYWWLRTPGTSSSTYAWGVNSSGSYSRSDFCSSTWGVRPALVLSSSLLVSDDGSVKTNQPPTAPTKITLPSTIKGGQEFAISWSGATDPDGDLLGYYLQRKIDDGTWQQIYQGTATSTTNIIPFGAADTVQFQVQAYDPSGEKSSWYSSNTVSVVNNTAPTAPATITVPMQVIGGEKLTVSWSSSQDSEQNLSGYKLERKVGSGAWTQIYSGPNLSFTDTITKGWTTVAYQVKAYDSLGDESGYTTSQTREVDNNTAPTITCTSSGDLGEKSAGFSISYTVDDVDGDVVTVVEAMDGVRKRSYTATLGTSNSFTVTGDYFMKLLNGQHTMAITATDTGGKVTTLTLTFTKTVHALRITIENPMTTDALIAKTVMNIVRSIPGDAEFKVLVTNNANDPSPVWEDITSNVQSGLNYLFENTTVANGHAFNFIITASRGASGQGGFINSIGGAFE